MYHSARVSNEFTKYYNLNEISKFANFENVFSLTKIKSISIWFSLDLSLEKSKLAYIQKSLVSLFLLYLITNKYPKIRSSKDQRSLSIECYLVSNDLAFFLEKFLTVYDSKKRSQLLKDIDISSSVIRLLVKDFSLFSELKGFTNFFSSVEWLYIDIVFNHKDNSRNLLFLDNIFTSSYLV